jgi:dTDP-4-dehydrorhamnose reductase
VATLVIGADGLVGGAVMRALAAKGRTVFGTTRRIGRAQGRFLLDLANESVETVALPAVKTAILCAAVNGFAHCRADPQTAYRVNVGATETLARRLHLQGSRLLYLSSSAVFDFLHGHVPAHHPRCPRTIYGANKAAAEQCVLDADPANTIVRLTKVIAQNTSHFSAWLVALRSNSTVRAYHDLHFCPITLAHAANAIIEIADRGVSGIYQVSGAYDISYADAARHLAAKMGSDESCVIAESAVSYGIPREEVARFTSLDASKYSALTGQMPPAPYEVLDNVFDSLIADLVARR